ncbi:Reverse transcriptase [Theobroma cacao]|nr:Reverse transcriptase [Theobroma cacao]
MDAEINMIKKNKTWILVNRPNNHNVIGVKWIFRTKLNLDGSVNKYKAILVVKGFAQVYGVDYMETFPPVTRHDTIRLLAALSARKDWQIYHLDIKSAFLNGYLKEDFFVKQPDEYVEKGSKNKWGVYLGSKKQEVVAQSSAAEAEYIATASTVNQALWLRKILAELGFSQNEGILLNVDNQSTMEIAKNPMRHGRTKHIRVKFHALRKAMREGEVVLEYCQTDEQVADIFTKGLSVIIFCIFEKQIGCLPNWNQGGVLKTQ